MLQIDGKPSKIAGFFFFKPARKKQEKKKPFLSKNYVFSFAVSGKFREVIDNSKRLIMKMS